MISVIICPPFINTSIFIIFIIRINPIFSVKEMYFLNISTCFHFNHTSFSCLVGKNKLEVISLSINPLSSFCSKMPCKVCCHQQCFVVRINYRMIIIPGRFFRSSSNSCFNSFKSRHSPTFHITPIITIIIRPCNITI